MSFYLEANLRWEIEIPRTHAELCEMLSTLTIENVMNEIEYFKQILKHAEYNVYHTEENLKVSLDESLLDDGAAYDSFKAIHKLDKKVEAEVIEIIRLLSKWKLNEQRRLENKEQEEQEENKTEIQRKTTQELLDEKEYSEDRLNKIEEGKVLSGDRFGIKDFFRFERPNQIKYLKSRLIEINNELEIRKEEVQEIKSVEFDYLPLVQAIRQNKLVGSGTCSDIDECFDYEDIVDNLKKQNITTVKKAVEWAIEHETLLISIATNYSSGEPNCYLLKRDQNWSKKLEQYRAQNA